MNNYSGEIAVLDIAPQLKAKKNFYSTEFYLNVSAMVLVIF